MSPSRAGAWINLASCFNNLREYDSALVAYSQAERVDSLALLRDNINHEWGSTFVRLGRPFAAESAFRRILGRSEPGQRMRGYRSLAWLAMYQGRYREAIQLFRESNVMLQSEAKVSWLSVFRNQVNMAHAAISRNDSAAARAMLREARKLLAPMNPNPVTLYWMAYGHLRLGKRSDSKCWT
jgi:tetratricopeptide (TPR) repeat protein